MTQSRLSPNEVSLSSEELKTVTRADLAEAVHRHTGLGRADCAKYVEMVLDEIFEAIVTRDDVKLSSFGAFQIRAKRERQGRNPKTGKEAKITARLVVTFKPSNVLRARVNSDFKVPAPPPKAARKANGAAKLAGNGEAGDSHGLPGLSVKAKQNGMGASR
jgi:integration host factor subunit alpha